MTHHCKRPREAGPPRRAAIPRRPAAAVLTVQPAEVLRGPASAASASELPLLDQASIQERWPSIRGWHAANDGIGCKSMISRIQKEHRRIAPEGVPIMLVRARQAALTPRVSLGAVSQESADVLHRKQLRCANGYDSFASTYANELHATAPAHALREACWHVMCHPRHVSELDEGSLQQRWPLIRGWYAANDGISTPTTYCWPAALPTTLAQL